MPFEYTQLLTTAVKMVGVEASTRKMKYGLIQARSKLGCSLKHLITEISTAYGPALGSAMHQYLITVPKSAYRDAFKKWIHQLKLCISSHREYFEGMK